MCQPNIVINLMNILIEWQGLTHTKWSNVWKCTSIWGHHADRQGKIKCQLAANKTTGDVANYTATCLGNYYSYQNTKSDLESNHSVNAWPSWVNLRSSCSYFSGYGLSFCLGPKENCIVFLFCILRHVSYLPVLIYFCLLSIWSVTNMDSDRLSVARLDWMVVCS